MPETQLETVKTVPAPAAAEDQLVGESLVDEELVEEVSIDGMCGVY